MGVLALTLRLALLLDLKSEGLKLMVSKIFSMSIFLNAFLTPPPKPFIHLYVVWQQIYMGVF